MTITRRSFLAVAPMAALPVWAGTQGAPKLGIVIHSLAVRSRKPLPPEYPAISDPADFLNDAHRCGFAGIQVGIPTIEKAAQLRRGAETNGMFVEGIVALPKDERDRDRFTTELQIAAAAGADTVRTVCMTGRRYETMTSARQFEEFAKRSEASLKLAEPLAAKSRIRIAVENHKDWRAEEMVDWLKRISSEWIRVCLDTGNNIALLEEPMATIAALAPYAVSSHLKDMAVKATADGFTLAEVPFGTGRLDLPRIVKTMQAANPRIRIHLEMITRDPLSVPCLKETYWPTMSGVSGSQLARHLAWVRSGATADSSTISSLSHVDQLKRERENNRESLDFYQRRCRD